MVLLVVQLGDCNDHTCNNFISEVKYVWCPGSFATCCTHLCTKVYVHIAIHVVCIFSIHKREMMEKVVQLDVAATFFSIHILHNLIAVYFFSFACDSIPRIIHSFWDFVKTNHDESQ